MSLVFPGQLGVHPNLVALHDFFETPLHGGLEQYAVVNEFIGDGACNLPGTACPRPAAAASAWHSGGSCARCALFDDGRHPGDAASAYKGVRANPARVRHQCARADVAELADGDARSNVRVSVDDAPPANGRVGRDARQWVDQRGPRPCRVQGGNLAARLALTDSKTPRLVLRCGGQGAAPRGSCAPSSSSSHGARPLPAGISLFGALAGSLEELHRGELSEGHRLQGWC